jgi:hypothetical protein
LLFFFWLSPRIEAWLVKKGFFWQLGTSMGLPTLLLILNPSGSDDFLTAVGALMGVATGVAAERRWVRFYSGGSYSKQVIRYFLGIIVLVGLWIGLRSAFSQLEPTGLFRVIRYALVGLWGGLGAPWMFVHLNLAERE